MKNNPIGAWYVPAVLAATAGLLWGCASSPDSIPARTPAQRAAEFSQTRCTGYADDTAIKDILSGNAVERVAPLYNGVGGSRTSAPHLEGAVVYVRPAPGQTAEWLDRALECHSARSTSAQGSGLVAGSDPFFLPDAHVNIRVSSAGDTFRIDLEGASPAEAHDILTRASAFAGPSRQGQGIAGQPELP